MPATPTEEVVVCENVLVVSGSPSGATDFLVGALVEGGFAVAAVEGIASAVEALESDQGEVPHYVMIDMHLRGVHEFITGYLGVLMPRPRVLPIPGTTLSMEAAREFASRSLPPWAGDYLRLKALKRDWPADRVAAERAGVSPARLRYGRWLVAQGRVTDDAGAGCSRHEHPPVTLPGQETP